MLALTLMTAWLAALGVEEDPKAEGLKIHARSEKAFVCRKSVAIKTGEQLVMLIPANGKLETMIKGVAGQLKVDTIDFEKQMLIVIYGGEQRTGGYRVELKSLERKDDKLIVHWKLKSPPPDAIVTQAITHPTLVLLVDRFEGEVVFDPPPKEEKE